MNYETKQQTPMELKTLLEKEQAEQKYEKMTDYQRAYDKLLEASKMNEKWQDAKNIQDTLQAFPNSKPVSEEYSSTIYQIPNIDKRITYLQTLLSLTPGQRLELEILINKRWS